MSKNDLEEAREVADYWERKAENLEKRAKEDRQSQHLIVAMVIGVVIYGLLGLGFGAGVIGFAVAAVYYVVTTKLLKDES